MERGHDADRSGPLIAVAVVAAFVLLVAGLAAWWFLAPQQPRVAPSAARPAAKADEPAPFPAEVDAVTRERELAAVPPPAPATRPEPESEPRAARSLGAFQGRLVADGTAAPVAGALLLAARVEVPSDDRQGCWIRIASAEERARSGVDGRFTVSDLRDDELLFASGPGLAATVIRLDHLTPPGDATFDTAVAEGARLVGRATGRDGAPVAGARVTVRSELLVIQQARIVTASGVRFPRFEFVATTDARGEVVIESLPTWVQLVSSIEPPEALAPDEATRAALRRVDEVALRLGPGEKATREWRFGGGATLRGRLVDETGAPLADALLWLLRGDAELEATPDGRRFSSGDETHVTARRFTDEAGGFAFDEVAPGRWWIGPAPWSRAAVGHASHDLVPLATPVELREGEVAREIELHAKRGLFVTGRAVDRRGKGVPGSLEAWPGPARVHVDDEGYFRVGPLAAGDHELRMTPQSASYAPPAASTVAAGTRSVQIDVPDGARLDVTCTAPDGRVVVASVVAVPLDGAGERKAWLGGRGLGGDSDDAIEGLPAGRYSIGATSEEGLAGVVDAVALAEGDQKRVTVEMVPAAVLELRLGDPSVDRATVSLSSGGLVIAVREVARGATLRCPVLPGIVRVRATIGAATLVRDLEVAAGERSEVVVDER